MRKWIQRIEAPISWAFAVVFALLAGTSIGELAGGEWNQAAVSGIIALAVALLWHDSRKRRAALEHLERERRIISSVLQDLQHIWEEIHLAARSRER